MPRKQGAQRQQLFVLVQRRQVLGVSALRGPFFGKEPLIMPNELLQIIPVLRLFYFFVKNHIF